MRKNITVIAKMKNTGEILPLSIEWEDGRIFDIDKVIDHSPRASTKGGGMGIRYEVCIKDQTRYLFLDQYIWFIEI